MNLPTCPACGSDDLTRDDATPHGSDAIGLRCLGCGHRWSRHPKVVCRRCGSQDIEYGAYQTLTHLVGAADVSATAVPGSVAASVAASVAGSVAGSVAASESVAHETFRCRKCNQRWHTGRGLHHAGGAVAGR